MSTRRTDIRNAMAAALVSKTAAGRNVLTSRYTALFADTFPLILIYSPTETADFFVAYPPQYNRKLTVNLSAIVQVNDDIDIMLDTISQEIETAIGVDPTFGGLAMGLVLQKTESEVDNTGEGQFGAIHLTYEVLYTA